MWLQKLAYLLGQIWRLIESCFNWLRRQQRPVVVFENGKQVEMGKQIAEGGFSFVFEARDVSSSGPFNYALKRVVCPDPELVQSCQREAQVHRAVQHPNLMPLLGIVFQQNSCFMIFPCVPISLRDEISQRNLLQLDPTRQVRPFSQAHILSIFVQLVEGVSAMHQAGWAHRDIKVENVLMADSKQPILMDFGSARPLTVQLRTRQDVLQLVEEAASHTTLPYRAPELFEGGCRHGTVEPDVDGGVDVWSLACLLFAMMYGASPFECEFAGPKGIRIVECTHLRVLGEIPTAPSQRYSLSLHNFVEWMLTQDRSERPNIAQVLHRAEELLEMTGETSALQRSREGDQGEPFDGLL